MQITKTHKIIISAVAVIILVGLYIAFDRNSRRSPDIMAGTSGSEATTTSPTTTKEIGNSGVSITGAGNFKVEQVSGGTPQIPIPDLNRKIVFGTDPSLTPEVKTLITQKVTDFQTQLKKDPTILANWINMGIYLKMAGDYNGAIISWKYASAIAPSDYIALGDLGNLYAYFLHDNIKAVASYNLAISKGPVVTYLYIQLAEIYRDIFKDLDKARAIIVQGLTNIPNDSALLQFQSSLK